MKFTLCAIVVWQAGMIFAVSDEVWIELIKTFASIFAPIAFVIVGYWQWRLKQAQDKAAKEEARREEEARLERARVAAEQARREEEAKLERDKLAAAIERNSKVTDASHRLINSQAEGQLELMTLILEQKAKASGDPEDVEFAKMARNRYEDQIAVTKKINSEQLTGLLQPASLESPASSLPGGPPAPVLRVEVIEAGEIKVTLPVELQNKEEGK